MMMEFTLLRSTSPNSSETSNERDGSVTTVPPRIIAMRLENWPVPCMSGHADSSTNGGQSGPIRPTSSSLFATGW
ncbi:unannotated protein [freshwater metagenome]|uniref:Unannotated protein n=1 Tax=freshwater metagenome TaxID=449393 RepID=A0A6J7F306_9ZZZZ